MDDDVWLGDDEDEPLPVLPLPGGQQAPPDELPPVAAGHRRQPPPKGVPLPAVADVRRAILQEATGKALMIEPEQWREDMAEGKRDRAASSLEAGGHHHSSSGFGLA